MKYFFYEKDTGYVNLIYHVRPSEEMLAENNYVVGEEVEAPEGKYTRYFVKDGLLQHEFIDIPKPQPSKEEVLQKQIEIGNKTILALMSRVANLEKTIKGSDK